MSESGSKYTALLIQLQLTQLAPIHFLLINTSLRPSKCSLVASRRTGTRTLSPTWPLEWDPKGSQCAKRSHTLIASSFEITSLRLSVTSSEDTLEETNMSMRPAPPRPGEPPRPQAIPQNPNGPAEQQGNRTVAGTSVTSSQGFHGTSVPAGAHGQHAPNPKVVRIGQYELGSTLGVGSFGKVKRKESPYHSRLTGV